MLQASRRTGSGGDGAAADQLAARLSSLSLSSSSSQLYLHFDGGARGNHLGGGGAASSGGCAAVLVDARTGAAVEHAYRGLGACTNNVAEYEGLLLALKLAIDLGVQPSRIAGIRGDSQLVVRQVRGEWAVREDSLASRFLEARRLLARLGVNASILEHVERERNALADRLVNRAIDTQASFSPAARAAAPPLLGGRSRAASAAGVGDDSGPGDDAAAAAIKAGAARGVCRMAAIAGAVRDFCRVRGLDAAPEYAGAPRLSARKALERASARGALSEAREQALRRELGQLEQARRAERLRVAAFAAADHDLAELNDWLRGFGRDAAPSKAAAIKALGALYANIYDVADGVFRDRKSLTALAWHSKLTGLIIPLKEATDDMRKVFLKNIKRCW